MTLQSRYYRRRQLSWDTEGGCGVEWYVVESSTACDIWWLNWIHLLWAIIIHVEVAWPHPVSPKSFFFPRRRYALNNHSVSQSWHLLDQTSSVLHSSRRRRSGVCQSVSSPSEFKTKVLVWFVDQRTTLESLGVTGNHLSFSCPVSNW